MILQVKEKVLTDNKNIQTQSATARTDNIWFQAKTSGKNVEIGQHKNDQFRRQENAKEHENSRNLRILNEILNELLSE